MDLRAESLEDVADSRGLWSGSSSALERPCRKQDWPRVRDELIGSRMTVCTGIHDIYAMTVCAGIRDIYLLLRGDDELLLCGLNTGWYAELVLKRVQRFPLLDAPDQYERKRSLAWFGCG